MKLTIDTIRRYSRQSSAFRLALVAFAHASATHLAARTRALKTDHMLPGRNPETSLFEKNPAYVEAWAKERETSLAFSRALALLTIELEDVADGWVTAEQLETFVECDPDGVPEVLLRAAHIPRAEQTSMLDDPMWQRRLVLKAAGVVEYVDPSRHNSADPYPNDTMHRARREAADRARDARLVAEINEARRRVEGLGTFVHPTIDAWINE